MADFVGSGRPREARETLPKGGGLRPLPFKRAYRPDPKIRPVSCVSEFVDVVFIFCSEAERKYQKVTG